MSQRDGVKATQKKLPQKLFQNPFRGCPSSVKRSPINKTNRHFKLFDRDARRRGPTNHFVGFQNQGFTQKFTRNALDWIKLDQIGSERIR